MNNEIKELVDRYIAVSFMVNRTGENLIKNEVGSTLTNDQHYTLRYIHGAHSCTSTELAEVFAVKKSAITAIISRLWEKGFILRTRNEKDRRVVYLSLTEKGERLFLETETKIHKLVESFLNEFEQAEIQQFIQTYEKLNKILIERKEVELEECL
ncbi:MarR family winged helix-turn-helix transcriptional regulator [Cytobacillus purgationiresistens]|uniref:DNA-binding MarR family transcriptional regulator n=1 Tax=Cytobacillus purgationiresistens TaxID=863449 RepID=A0ABU0APG4_9BACI|nr:MarR family transcriptional regulator [Cytobacillus purgationiresistens]MDQ0272631.1 DNA-binding MarR family transcriptional regulator [Cytobacillus purgationiresistens]